MGIGEWPQVMMQDSRFLPPFNELGFLVFGCDLTANLDALKEKTQGTKKMFFFKFFASIGHASTASLLWKEISCRTHHPSSYATPVLLSPVLLCMGGDYHD